MAYVSLRRLFVAVLAVFPLLTWANVAPKTFVGDSASRIEERLNSMSLREKLGQLLLIDYKVHLLGGGLKTAEQAVREYHIGGFWIERGMAPDKLRRATTRLQNIAETPLFIAADYERGAGYNGDYMTELPSAMSLGASRDARLAEQAGRVVARESRALGVNLVFAPVVDVNNNPRNPIINIRSYGEDPAVVSEMAEAFVRGAERNGLLTTLKHFPGHGNTDTDSHSDLSRVSGSRSELEQMELFPYRQLLRAKVKPSVVMTGHLAVPALEPANIPATFSKKMLQGLLREQYGYDGLIITDGLNMGAVTKNYSYEDIILRPIEAGADLLLLPQNPVRAIQILENAVLTGRLTEERIDESVRRILKAKERIEIPKAAYTTDSEDLVGSIALEIGAEGLELAQMIADRAVTLLQNENKTLPIAENARVALVQMTYGKGSSSITRAMTAFARNLKNQSLQVTECRSFENDRACDAQTATTRGILNQVEAADVVVIAMFLRPSERRGNVGLNPDQAALATQIMNTGRKVVLVTFGNPYVIDAYPKADAIVATYDQTVHSAQAVARQLTGQLKAYGQLPVSAGRFRLGDSISGDLGARPVVTPMSPAPVPAITPQKNILRTF